MNTFRLLDFQVFSGKKILSKKLFISIIVNLALNDQIIVEREVHFNITYIIEHFPAIMN